MGVHGVGSPGEPVAANSRPATAGKAEPKVKLHAMDGPAVTHAAPVPTTQAARLRPAETEVASALQEIRKFAGPENTDPLVSYPASSDSEEFNAASNKLYTAVARLPAFDGTHSDRQMWEAAKDLAIRVDNGSRAIDAYNVMAACNAVRENRILDSLESFRLANPAASPELKKALDNAKDWIESPDGLRSWHTASPYGKFERLLTVLPLLSPSSAAYLMAQLQQNGIQASAQPKSEIDRLEYYLAAPPRDELSPDARTALQLIDSYRRVQIVPEKT